MQCPPQILAPLLNMSKAILIVHYLHIVNLFVTQNKMCTIIIICKQDTLNKISSPGDLV